MPLLTIILVLVIVGVVLWAINAFIPMPANYKHFLNIAVIILTVIWLLSVIGVFSSLGSVRIGN